MDIKAICKQAVEKYGNNAQMDMVIEECSELIQAISKNKRGKNNRQNIAEEIADVEIMLEQLKIIMDICNTEVEIWKQFKINRLSEKLDIDGV